MRIVVFGEDQRVGASVGEQIIDLNRAYTRYLTERGDGNAALHAAALVPAGLAAFIEGGDATLEAAAQAIEYAGSANPAGLVHAADSVTLHAPWARKRILCAGGNFGDHLLGFEQNSLGNADATLESVSGAARAAGVWGFWKLPSDITQPGGDIPYPKRVKLLDFEGEVAIVWGKRRKDVKASHIERHIWGVTLLNDWSQRDHPPKPRGMSFNTPKNFDGSTTVGPSIIVGELNPENLDVETKVNGEVRQRFNTGGMIFSYGEIAEFVSRDFTFVPGDMISGGTGAGTAADSSKRGPDGKLQTELFLKPGDVVEITAPRIGTLRQRIVEPDA